MRAWRVHETGSLDGMRLEELPDPVPGPGEVVIAVEAAAIGFPDLLQVLGLYQARPALPFTPGRELAGVVSAVGPGVDGVGEGDRVVTLAGGAWADTVVAPAAECLPVPAAMPSTDAAALLINYGTAIIGLHDRGHLQEGETLLVTASAGGVGSAAVQIGKAAGARVVGVAGGPAKVATTLALGADHAFDAGEPLVDAVRTVTGRDGVDVCCESVGGDVFDQACRLMAWAGRLLVVGFAGGRIPQVATNHVLLKGYSVIGVNSDASAARDATQAARLWARIVALYEDGAVAPLLAPPRPLDDVPTALLDLGTRATTGKLVITP
jgi:NADPH2:quinone reductase